MIPYLDSRFKQTNGLKAIDKGNLKEDVNDILVSRLNFAKQEIEDKIMDENETITTNIKLEFIDLPGTYHYLDE